MNGLEFKQWRENAALTMRDVQALTAISIGSLSRFENGKGMNNTNYQRLLDLVNGVEPTTADKQERIQWHIKQLEILTKGE